MQTDWEDDCGAGKHASYLQVQIYAPKHISQNNWTKKACGGSQTRWSWLQPVKTFITLITTVQRDEELAS